MREKGGVAGSQPMSTAVHRSPNKLWRSNAIFNLWAQLIKILHMDRIQYPRPPAPTFLTSPNICQPPPHPQRAGTHRSGMSRPRDKKTWDRIRKSKTKCSRTHWSGTQHSDEVIRYRISRMNCIVIFCFFCCAITRWAIFSTVLWTSPNSCTLSYLIFSPLLWLLSNRCLSSFFLEYFFWRARVVGHSFAYDAPF